MQVSPLWHGLDSATHSFMSIKKIESMVLPPPNAGQRSQMTLSSPAQLPAASSIKPAGHVFTREHWNEPGVLVQRKSAPQLWVPKVHSSRSATGKEGN